MHRGGTLALSSWLSRSHLSQSPHGKLEAAQWDVAHGSAAVGVQAVPVQEQGPVQMMLDLEVTLLHHTCRPPPCGATLPWQHMDLDHLLTDHMGHSLDLQDAHGLVEVLPHLVVR
jgi:hypothetical protein